MRKKLPTNEKRNNFIGIKVKPELKEKLAYISKRDVKPISTYINEILEKTVNDYFEIAHLNWDQISKEEKGGGETN